MVRKNSVKKDIIPFSRPMSLFDVLEELEKEMWDSWRPFPETGLIPHTDMFEKKGQLIMKAELPGINKKDLDISLEGDRLTIKAETKEEGTGDKKHHSRGRHYRQYFHSVMLPYPVNKDKVSATLNKGVLELTLPKAEEVKAKKIEIKAEIPKIAAKKRELKG